MANEALQAAILERAKRERATRQTQQPQAPQRGIGQTILDAIANGQVDRFLAIGNGAEQLILGAQDAEGAGGFEFGPCGPATVLVAVRRTGMGCEISFFNFAVIHKVSQGVRLAGPVSVDELPELVYEGEESLCIEGPGAAFGADIVDLEGVVALGLINEDEQLGNIGSVDSPGVCRCYSHADQSHRLGKSPWAGKYLHSKRS